VCVERNGETTSEETNERLPDGGSWRTWPVDSPSAIDADATEHFDALVTGPGDRWGYKDGWTDGWKAGWQAGMSVPLCDRPEYRGTAH